MIETTLQDLRFGFRSCGAVLAFPSLAILLPHLGNRCERRRVQLDRRDLNSVPTQP